VIDLNHVNELISIRDAFGMSNDLGLDNLKATIQVEFGDQGICSRNSSKGNSNCNDKQRHHTKSPVTRHIQKNVKKTTPIYLNPLKPNSLPRNITIIAIKHFIQLDTQNSIFFSTKATW